MKQLIFSFFICLSLQGAEFEMRTFIDGIDELFLDADTVSHVEMQYLMQRSGMPHRMFMRMHEKAQHMIVVGENGAHFSHVHPSLNQETGVFSILANAETNDFDNFMQPKMFPYAGRYHVFTEAMPMMPGRELPMEMDRFEVVANGTRPMPELERTFPDATEGLYAFFDSKGSKAEDGAFYKIKFRVAAFDYCSYYLPKFYFEVFTKNHIGEYERADGFIKWLGMGGHSVLLGMDQTSLNDRIFYHLHAFLPIATKGSFTFPYHDHTKPLPFGNYRIFGQLRHGDLVLTMPFNFHYRVTESQRKCL